MSKKERKYRNPKLSEKMYRYLWMQHIIDLAARLDASPDDVAGVASYKEWKKYFTRQTK